MVALKYSKRKFRNFFAPLALAASIGTAIAQEIPKFPITKFQVDGNTLLEPGLVDATLQPFVGSQRDFGDMQRALEALEAAYRARGYQYVSVLLPEQVLERGEVRLQVIEARIQSVSVEGQRHFDPANIRASVPALKEGNIPLMNDISASLRVANENPAKKIRVLFAPGDKDQDLVATIHVVDEKPWKLGATLDNTGSGHAGPRRLGVVYQHGNLFNLDHVLTMQYQTSVERPQDVSVYALGYRIPFYALGDVLDIYATRSDVDSGTVGAGPLNLAITGKGSVVGLKYASKLRRIGDFEHELTAGLDSKKYTNSIVAAGVQLGNDLNVHPLSIQYAGRWMQAGSDLNFNLGLVQNIPGGKDGDQTAITLARTGASKDYSLVRAGASFIAALPSDWQARVAATAQWARSPLVSGEQFGIGGANSVRGFEEREVANDKGIQGNFELYTPELCGKVMAGQQCRLLAFYDFGSLHRNSPLVGEIATENIASTGVGARWSIGRDMSLQADYGYVLQGTPTRESGNWKLHMRLGYFF